MVNTSQQIGGAVGLALLSTVSASSVAHYARAHTGLPGLAGAAAVHGYTTGFWWAAGIFAVGLIIALTVFPRRIKDELVADGAEPAGGDVSLATD